MLLEMLMLLFLLVSRVQEYERCGFLFRSDPSVIWISKSHESVGYLLIRLVVDVLGSMPVHIYFTTSIIVMSTPIDGLLQVRERLAPVAM
jgi:hypothetical protein